MSKKKNIIFVVADSLRYDSILQGGDYLLPYTNQNAIVFTQARSAGSWTLPATASMFSGQSLHEHGATSQTRVINAETELLAERFKREGYRTLQVTANSATTHIFGLDRGFDKVEKIWEMAPRRHGITDVILTVLAKPRLRKKIFQSGSDLVMGKFSEEIMSASSWMQSNMDYQFERAAQHVQQAKEDKKPLFLFVNLMETHFPYHISDTFSTSSKNPVQQLREILSLFHFVNQSRLTTTKEKISAQMLQVLRKRQQSTWRMIAPSLDNFLKKMHQDSDNVVLFASDHGDNFGEQDKWQYHFSNVNDAGNRTALFFLKAGEQSNQIIDTPVSMRHLHGSILSHAGVASAADRGRIDLTKNPHLSLPVLESFWYNKNGKTLQDYRYNQFAFLCSNKKYVWRNERWLQSQIALSGIPQESPYEPLDLGVNPIEEADLEKPSKKELRENFKNFQRFEETVRP